MFENPRRLRRPEERVGIVTNADLPPPMVRDEDSNLVARIRARDESAFAQLLDRYHVAMARVARMYVRSPEEAEEVIQDTWIAVLSGIDRFEGRSAFKTWLFRILINRARTRAKREARSIPLSALSSEEHADRATPVIELEPYSWAHSVPAADPEQAVLDGELRAVLDRAVNTLPDQQRAVISLRDIEGWPADEVCAALNISDGNQRVLLHRARLRVREALSPYLELEPALR